MMNMSLPAGRTGLLLAIGLLAGVSIQLSTALENISLMLLVGVALTREGRTHFAEALKHPVVIGSLALYFLFALSAAYTSASWPEARGMLVKLRPYLLLPLLFCACRLPPVRNGVVWGFVAATVLALALSLLMALFGWEILKGSPGRWASFRTNTYHNLFLAWTACGLLALVLHKTLPPRFRNLALIVLALAAFDVFYLVDGRGGQILFGLALLLTVLLWNPRKGMAVAVLAAAVVAPTVWFTSNTLQSGFARAQSDVTRFSSGEDKRTSVGQRLEWHRVGVQIFKDAPLTGHGAASFRTEFERRTGSTQEQAAVGSVISGSNPHNDFLLVATETGVLGLGALLVILGGGALAAWRGDWPKPQKHLALVVLVTMTIGTMANSFFFDNITGLAFTFLLAALLAGPLGLRADK